ncbi:hypothetical protein [Glycocaulis abyssi]|uniref:Uncharacterized protein n=1 Tax=Glycocaulis abyssi TaxID=1433403 RepID=A0ABV9NGG2_9PROT
MNNAIYWIVLALIADEPAIQRNLDNFRDMHQSMATFAYEAGRTSYIFGPFANDIFNCAERAREISPNIGEIVNYGVKITQRANTITYDYNPLYYIEELHGPYEYVRAFSCTRYTHNDSLIIYMDN